MNHPKEVFNPQPNDWDAYKAHELAVDKAWEYLQADRL